MKWLDRRLPHFAKSFWRDENGIILPYVTVLLVVIVGMAALALDGGRYMSLQTQMQAAADSLALAGARELNQRSGAQDRAERAMASTSLGNTNTLSGMGTAPTFAYTYKFYISIPAASGGFTGTEPTGTQDQKDLTTKFVAVTVAPVTIPTILPIKFFDSAAANSFSTGARAIAGFTAVTVCNVAPIFMCNPYETSAMTDAQATAALVSALDPNDPNFQAITLRRQIRMIRSASSNVSAGNFGWVQTADGCNNTSCMRTNMAAASGACYSSNIVHLGTGNSNTAENYFDTRFDIYKLQSPNAPITAANAPAINVRKGFLPNSATNPNWCTLKTPANPSYYTTLPVYQNPPIINTSGSVTGNGTVRKTITGMPSGDVTNITVGQAITGTNIPSGTTVSTKVSTTSITISNAATGSGTIALTLKIQWPTSPLPLDKQWTGICDASGKCLQGNGDWDCADYWAINHPGVAAPSGCTVSNPTLSRYDVYRYEIANSRINDWSGNGSANNVNNPTGNGENGAPLCAASNSVSGIDITTGGLDRRTFLVPIINCHSTNVSGQGSNATAPVAAFAKFFMTQPYETPVPPPPVGDGNSYIYGEMTSLLGSGDKTTIMNQVQLYR